MGESSEEVVPPDIPITFSQCLPLNPRQSPAAMSGEEQIVMESPTKYEAPVGSRLLVGWRICIHIYYSFRYLFIIGSVVI